MLTSVEGHKDLLVCIKHFECEKLFLTAYMYKDMHYSIPKNNLSSDTS